MFGRFLRRNKPRVFLGTLAVVPRTDFKKIDEWGLLENANLDIELKASLVDIFSLPLASQATDPKSTDLVLDVIISNYQSGDAWSVDLGEMGFPIFWRPKVEVRSRLYYLKTNKIKHVFSAKYKMKWSSFISRLFTWRSFFRFKPLFDKTDMELLVYQACDNLLIKMRKKI